MKSSAVSGVTALTRNSLILSAHHPGPAHGGASYLPPPPSPQKPRASLTATTRRSWEMFAGSILCMAFAGTVYWLPALGPGLAAHLHLSAGEATLVLAAANSGVGLLGGVLYERCGPKWTTVIGGALASGAYLKLALLVRSPPRRALVPAICCALAILLAAYITYSAVMATCGAFFPPRHRGRVLGFLTAVYGMSAGTLAVVQAAFFPALEDTERLLYCVALLTATPVPVALLLFPSDTAPPVPAPEETPLLLPQPAASGPPDRGTEDALLTATYVLAFAIAGVLQVGAYFAWVGDVHIPLPRVLTGLALQLGQPTALTANVVCAMVLTLLLLSFALLPFGFRPSTAPPTADDEDGAASEVAGMPLAVTVRDMRFQLMAAAFFALPGCATVTTLIRIADVAETRMYAAHTNAALSAGLHSAEDVANAVRALIVAFSACNMLSRLIAGAVSEVGETARARENWKLRLVEADFVLMAVATCGVAFSSSWKLVVSVGLVGYAHGSFFAICPTLVSHWFGIDGLPMTFAAIAGSAIIATLGVSSGMATAVAGLVEKTSWVVLIPTTPGMPTTRLCAGTWCYAPTYCFIAAMNCVMLVAFLLLHRRILETSSPPKPVSSR